MDNLQKITGRIIITGGSGFLGRAVYEKIRRENATIPIVFLLHKTIPSYAKESPYTTYIILKDADVSKIFQKNDTVLHLAGKTHSFSRREYFEINYEFTKILAEAARAQGARLFIYASTRAVSDIKGGYGASKRAAEEAIKKSGVPFIILRFAEVYGPGSHEGISQFIEATRNKKFIVYPYGGAPLAPLSLSDTTNVLARAIFADNLKGNTYIIAGPASFSMREILSILLRIYKRRALLFPIPFFLVKIFAYLGVVFHVPGIVPDQVSRLKAPKENDISAAKSDLSFHPISFEEGVRRMYTGST